MIEFFPWYQAGQALVRCGGDGGCGALLADGDTDQHLRWHLRIEANVELTNAMERKVQSRRVVGTW